MLLLIFLILLVSLWEIVQKFVFGRIHGWVINLSSFSFQIFLRFWGLETFQFLLFKSVLFLCFLEFQFPSEPFQSKIEELTVLLSSFITCVPFTFLIDVRVQLLKPSQLFLVSSFFTARLVCYILTAFVPTKFIWKSKAPLKANTFAQLVINKKVDINKMLQMKRPHKALILDPHILCA